MGKGQPSSSSWFRVIAHATTKTSSSALVKLSFRACRALLGRWIGTTYAILIRLTENLPEQQQISRKIANHSMSRASSRIREAYLKGMHYRICELLSQFKEAKDAFLLACPKVIYSP